MLLCIRLLDIENENAWRKEKLFAAKADFVSESEKERRAQQTLAARVEKKRKAKKSQQDIFV